MKNTSKRKRITPRPRPVNSASSAGTEGRTWGRTIVAGSALVSLFPLWYCWGQLNELFFFHDDFLLLDELNRSTLFGWIFHPFENESIFPLFKVLWIGALWSFGGSYIALIVLQWITHLVLCLVFGWLLLRVRMAPVTAGIAVLTFGLASSNIETLAWSIQWGAQLSLLFFLLAWHALLRILERESGFRWYVWYVSCIVASTLCSSRGIVCGMLLAVYTLLAGGRSKMKLCAVSVVPTVLLVLVTWLWVPVTKVSQVGAFTYGLDYLALNPLYALMPVGHEPGKAGVVLLFGAVKAVVIAWAFHKCPRNLRAFLVALVVFDAATAAALGYARAWTGLTTTVSSRYQYISLLCFGPMIGVIVAGWKREVRIVAIVLWIGLLAYRWQENVDRWVFVRGTRIRQELVRYPRNAPFDPSKLTAGRARQLIEEYQLH